MKYVLNTGRYDISFEVKVNNRAEVVKLYRRRFYMDTGNLAMQGITSVEDKVYEELNKLSQFKALIKKGELKLVKEKDMLSSADAKDKEIAELKAELEKVKTADTEKELAAKDEEIKNLKEQLEALAKKETESENKPVETTEGF